MTITAIDSAGNTAPSYRGTIHFNSSDPRASLPADYTFTAADNGVHTFTAVLRTAGAQYVAAWDSGSFSWSIGTQANYTVTAAAAAQFLISAPTTAQAGVAFSLTLTVVDAYGNVVTGYTGTVHFTSSDPQAGLPADYTFGSSDAGVHTFSVILQTPGTQTIAIADTLNSSLAASAQVSL